MQCKICGGLSETAFRGTVLRKYEIAYYRCPSCDFMQTEEPYWLEEAYSSAISDLDLGPINRAVSGARVTEALILLCFDPNGRFIDWGGGYGVFTRLMRDRGYDFYWRDLYCENLFAKHFVAEAESGYELMTSFEVFEHLVRPMDEIATMLKRASNILFTTQLPPQRLTSATQWWYLTPEHGQHVAIYSDASLRFVANTFGLHLSSDGAGWHLLSQKPVSPYLFRTMVRDRRSAQIFRSLGRRRLRKPTLLWDDFRSITGWTP